LAVTRQGFENNIVLAAPFNFPAGSYAFRIREQNDLQQYRRVIRRPAAFALIVAVVGIENGKIELVGDQIMQRVFESAWLQLFCEIDNNHGGLVVVVMFEVGHWHDSVSMKPFYEKKL